MGKYADDLEFAKALASEVAEVARQRCQTLKTWEKENASFVTDLDLDLERQIRDRIAETYPDDRLVGEEYGAAGGQGPREWCIDPIDGTSNLVHGLPLWAVSIGLLESDVPVLGVIAVPPLNELYWATQGGGAWLDGHRIEAHEAEAFHSHDNVGIATNALRVLDVKTVPGRIRDLGSACTDLVFAACGRLRAAIFQGEQAHDLAAGAVIASEAGCQFGTIDGKKLSPAEFVSQTPVRVPTIIAPKQRLQKLQASVRRRKP